MTVDILQPVQSCVIWGNRVIGSMSGKLPTLFPPFSNRSTGPQEVNCQIGQETSPRRALVSEAFPIEPLVSVVQELGPIFPFPVSVCKKASLAEYWHGKLLRHRWCLLKDWWVVKKKTEMFDWLKDISMSYVSNFSVASPKTPLSYPRSLHCRSWLTSPQKMGPILSMPILKPEFPLEGPKHISVK